MRELTFLLMTLLLFGCTGYKIEDHKVYWTSWNEGTGSGKDLLDADYKTFKVLEHKKYAKDAKKVYYKGNKVQGADAESFKSIWDFYGTDINHAYYAYNKIPNSNGPTFEVLNGNFSRDDQNYYFNDKAIGVCDYQSFAIHDFEGAYGNWFSYDDKCAYYMANKIPIKDRPSFEILIGGYTKDDQAVYYLMKAVPDADPESFEMINNTFAGRDKAGCFNGWDRVECL
jgi:hypothetical protein